MRKSSKMLSLVIALIFLFSAVTPALALSSDADEAGARLKSLGIIAGYPDGSLGLERTITRAEMTVVLAEMSAMGSAADVLKSVPSKFSDVATNVWYTGYVNLAANQGWVSGYPDGSFKPNANVTYAEAVTMMLNVLGYSKGDLPGTWPLNYLVKAAELGITDDVTFSTGSPALRGDVFVFASASLDQEPVKWVSDDSEFVSIKDGETLLDKLGFELAEDVIVSDAYVLVGTGGEDDREVSSDNASVEYAAEGFDVRPYIGVKSDFYFNDDNEILAVKSSASVMTAEIDTVTEASYEIKFDGSSKTYNYEDAVVIVNEKLSDVSAVSIAEDSIVRYAVSGDDVTLLDFVDYSLMDSAGLVEDVDIDDELVMFDVYAGDAPVDIDTDDDNVTLIGVDSLEDIVEWDVVYESRDGDDVAIYVVRDNVSGKATSYNTTRIRVGSTNYDLGDVWFYSTNSGDSFATGSDLSDSAKLDALENFSEEDVTIVLDGYGDVFAIMSDVEITADNVAIVDEVLVGVDAYGNEIGKATLFLANGSVATYNFDTDEVTLVNASPDTVDGVSFAQKDVVEYSLNDDGEIDKFVPYSAYDDGVLALDEDEMDDYNRIDGKYVVDSTVFFSAVGTDADDWEVLTWAFVKANGDNNSGYGYWNDDNDLEVFVFTDELGDVEDNYAVFIDSWKIGSDVYVELAVSSGVVEYVYNVAGAEIVAWDENTLVEFDMSGGKVTTLTEIGNIEDSVLASSPYNSTRKQITIGGNAYDITSDTVIVNNSGSTPVVISASDIRRGDTVSAAVETIGSGELYVLVITER